MPMDGSAGFRERLHTRAERMRDLRPAMKVIGEEIVLRTANAFQSSKTPDGPTWPALAESTRLARKGARKLERRLNRETVSGKLTKAARKARGKYAAGRGVSITTGGAAVVWAKPLIDTGRLRAASLRYSVTAKSMKWSTLGYGAPHIAGTANGRPPQRNYSVLIRRGDKWAFNPSMLAFALSTLTRYVQTGAL